MILIIYYVIINLLAFFLFGIDKARARKGEWRIQEINLIFIAVFGGCFGAFAGMRVFHHKIKKIKFTLSIPFFMIIHGVIIYLYTFV